MAELSRTYKDVPLVHHSVSYNLCEGTGMNYLAILETALDIAKGMCHLHDHQVIHSDLKVGDD